MESDRKDIFDGTLGNICPIARESCGLADCALWNGIDTCSLVEVAQALADIAATLAEISATRR